MLYFCRDGALVSPPFPLEHEAGTPLKFKICWQPDADAMVNGTRLFCWGQEVSRKTFDPICLRGGDTMNMDYSIDGLRIIFKVATAGKNPPTVFDHVPERP